MLELATKRVAAFLLLFLFALPVAPALASTTQPVQPQAQPLPAAPSKAGTFIPDYMLLGQLEGSTVVQSGRPQSASLVGGVQFSATYYTPSDLQHAYGATALLGAGDGGQGKTIAIIDAYGDPTINQDLATFDSQFGLPPVSLTIIPVGPYKPENGITTGWDAETALDVEAAHAMAPYAHINLVVAANASNALFEGVKTVVDNHLGDVVSMSWGLGENTYGESGFSADGFLNYAYLDYYFQKGAAEGITFFAASGDYGAFAGTPTVTAGFPATSPFVTGVGGTTLFMSPSSSVDSSAQYQGEAAWSVSPQYVGSQGVSSGGGYSELFARPSYQAGAVSSLTRASPDVAADANPYTGLVIVLEGGTYVIGGTSLSSPLWAGMTAVMDQYVGKDLGALNPYLYSIYSDPQAYGSSFHQVTFGFNGAYSASPGYNLVTGLGSPNLPQLAQYVRGLASVQGASPASGTPGLSVSVSTTPGNSASAPAQYTYGEAFTISATAFTAAGSPVGTGSFTAQISSPQGSVASVPLSFVGGTWVGSYMVGNSDPPGSWTVTVTGASGSEKGTGFADVNIGDSIAILSPIPYPFAPPTPPGRPFQVGVVVSTPSGIPLGGQTLTAYLIFGGRVVTSAPMGDFGGGEYVTDLSVTSGDPQGSYTLVVNGTGVGSVYSYVYVGEGVTGVIVSPNDEAIPSASPGQLITLLAAASASSGDGLFTSNITARIYSQSGAEVDSVALAPAPNTVQFGAFNFFHYQQANYTIPRTLSPGFYKVEFISSYLPSPGGVTQMGNFTTGFYVSGPPLSYIVSHAASVVEGQSLTVTATITDSAGAPVTSGVFMATAIPTGYVYEAYLADYYGYTGIPMEYVPALGEWLGSYQLPSPLTAANAFTGNIPSVIAGPWTVFVAGESASAVNVVPSASHFDVLPFTEIPSGTMSPSNIAGFPLVTVNGSQYVLRGAAADSLTITALNVILEGDSFGSLTVTGGNVTLAGTTVGNLTASSSILALTAGSQVGTLSLTSTPFSSEGSTYYKLSPALPSIELSGLTGPIGTPTQFTATVLGAQIDNSTIRVTVDGSLVPAAVSAVPGGYSLSGKVYPSTLADGVHTIQINATQADGMTASYSSFFTSDAQVQALSSKVTSLSSEAALWINLSYALAVVAVLAVVLAGWALTSRQRTHPPPSGQV